MARLKEYKTLSEKAEFFRQDMNVIDVFDIDELFAYLDSEKLRECVFRGCSEAKFMMYNSAQRFYITHELYKQVSESKKITHYKNFIENLIKECEEWNGGAVRKLLESNKISSDDALAYLSYMQHYGIPSPLLDFTSNPYNALFFAIDDIKLYNSDNEIDNYFSIYLCYRTANIFTRFKEVFAKLTSSYQGEGIPYSKIFGIVVHIILPNDKAYKIVNNVNIINQEGLFFYFSHPLYPLEEVYKDVLPHYHRGSGFSEQLMEENSRFGVCLNIHKSLAPAIRKRLTEKGVTKEFLFPDIYKMKETIVDEATINVLKTKKDMKKKIIVSLRYLDKVGAIISSDFFDVTLNNHPTQVLGSGRIFRDDNNNCLAELALDVNINMELYFYYVNDERNDGAYWFSGLSLADNLYANRPAKKLKEMILEDKSDDDEADSFSFISV